MQNMKYLIAALLNKRRVNRKDSSSNTTTVFPTTRTTTTTSAGSNHGAVVSSTGVASDTQNGIESAEVTISDTNHLPEETLSTRNDDNMNHKRQGHVKKNKLAKILGGCCASLGITERVSAPYENDSVDRSFDDVPFLLKLVQTWAWEAVYFRCQTHPHEMLECYEYQQKAAKNQQQVPSHYSQKSVDSLLHFCLFGKAPFPLVEYIVTNQPEFVSERDIPNGNLPIHVACMYRSSTQIIELLLSSYPRSILVENYDGKYPFHLLCEYGCNEETFRLFLSNPFIVQAVNERDRMEQNRPFELLMYKNRLTHWLDEDSMCRRVSVPVTQPHVRQRFQRDTEWVKIMQLLLVEYYKEPWGKFKYPETNETCYENSRETVKIQNNYRGFVVPDPSPNGILIQSITTSNCSMNPIPRPSFPVVLAFISNEYCPDYLVRGALKLYPDQCLHVDKCGRTPLHIATSQLSRIRCSLEKSCLDIGTYPRTPQQLLLCNKETFLRTVEATGRTDDIVLTMITQCPQATYVRDGMGQLPFTCYVESCKRYYEECNNEKQKLNRAPFVLKNPLTLSLVVKSFIHANPTALGEVVDPHRYPHLYIQIWSELMRESILPSSNKSTTTKARVDASKVSSIQVSHPSNNMTLQTIYRSLLDNSSLFCA